MAQFKDLIITNAGLALMKTVSNTKTTLTLNVARLTDDPSLLTLEDSAIRELTVLPFKSNTVDFVARQSEVDDVLSEIDAVITNVNIKQDYTFTGMGLVFEQTGQSDILFAVAAATSSATLSAFTGSNDYSLDLTMKLALNSVKPTITFNQSGYLTPADGQQIMNVVNKHADDSVKNRVVDNGDNTVTVNGKTYQPVDKSDTSNWQQQAIFPKGDYRLKDFDTTDDFIAYFKSADAPVGMSIIRIKNGTSINGSVLGAIDCTVLNEGPTTGWFYVTGISSIGFQVNGFCQGFVIGWSGWRLAPLLDANGHLGDNPGADYELDDIYLSKHGQWLADIAYDTGWIEADYANYNALTNGRIFFRNKGTDSYVRLGNARPVNGSGDLIVCRIPKQFQNKFSLYKAIALPITNPNSSNNKYFQYLYTTRNSSGEMVLQWSRNGNIDPFINGDYYAGSYI